jgi:multisubunit Na+/H+ antiporter MnhE subunit
MMALLVRGAGLAAIYLLVLTSLAPGDILTGGILGLAVAFALRPRAPHRDPQDQREPAPVRVRGAAGMLTQTAVEMVRGSWRTVRFCLGAPARPGLVEVPREGRSPINVALWGVLTGEAPDEVVVDVDEERDVLVVHLVDVGDPTAVRRRHARAHERWQTKVVP